MDFDRYANTAGELAADLVNLLVNHPEREARTASDVATVLDEYDLELPVDASTMVGLRRLAPQLAEVFVAEDVDTAVARLNGLLADTPMAPRVSTHGDRGPHLHVEPRNATTLDRLRANCLMGLAAVLCDGGRMRLGACDAHGCSTVFVDTSRNARRRFCSAACSSRHHVAAHRARRAGA